MKIMIAEDEKLSRTILKTTLEDFGHEVIETADGMQALESYDPETVHVLISDWFMPEMDGLDLCRQVRARQRGHYTYFILLTSRQNDRSSMSLAMEAGVDDFLVKPLDADLLWTRLVVAERILWFISQIQRLKGLLPICMYCKKIRDDQNYWRQIENYIHEQTGADFSHGICPECYGKVMGKPFPQKSPGKTICSAATASNQPLESA